MVDESLDTKGGFIDSTTPYRCPCLGSQFDSETWFAYPAVENYCHKSASPQPISSLHQRAYCLDTDFNLCPIYQSEKWQGKLPKDIQGDSSVLEAKAAQSIRYILVGLGVVVLIGVVVTVLVIPKTDSAVDSEPTVLSSTTVPTLIQVSTANEIPSTVPSNTPIPTLIPSVVRPTVSPVLTNITSYASVEFETNLRAGPGTAYPVVGHVPSNIIFEVLGRDTLGVWLFIKLPELEEGWIFANQLKSIEDLDIIHLPVTTRVPQSTPTSQSNKTPTNDAQNATAAPAVTTWPSRLEFSIDLDLQPSAFSCGEPQIVNYFVEVDREQIRFERSNRAIIGNYDPETGDFNATADISDVTIVLTGTLSLHNGLISMEGVQRLVQSNKACVLEWSFTGQGLIER